MMQEMSRRIIMSTVAMMDIMKIIRMMIHGRV